MLILACLLLALAAVPLTGGRLAGLADVGWRHPWLVGAALAAQLVVLQVPGLPAGPSAVVHVLSYLVAAAFVVLNRRVRGLLLVAAGAASNGLVIALNGGTLPASEAAMRTAGIEVESGFVNSGVVADPVLGWLGDAFAVPAAVPFANVFSVGDVLVVAGAVWVVWTATRRAPGPADPEADPQPRTRRTARRGTSTQAGRLPVS